MTNGQYVGKGAGIQFLGTRASTSLTQGSLKRTRSSKLNVLIHGTLFLETPHVKLSRILLM